jgi:hypothetical protein
MCTRSRFEEHLNVPKTWSEKLYQKPTGVPNGKPMSLELDLGAFALAGEAAA